MSRRRLHITFRILKKVWIRSTPRQKATGSVGRGRKDKEKKGKRYGRGVRDRDKTCSRRTWSRLKLADRLDIGQGARTRKEGGRKKLEEKRGDRSGQNK